MRDHPLAMLAEGLLSLLFPPRCEICRALQEPMICARCREDFVAITAPFCRQCGLPFDPRAQAASHCPECREEPPAFDAARAAGVYDGALRHAIHAFKYAGVRALAGPLATFILDQVTLPFEVDALCPVPLHPARERMRGFNQSRLLAEALGQAWAQPVETLLARTQNTPPQMRLPAEERRRNVRGAFAVAGPVVGRGIALVDDVFTTGSTLRECSRALKRAGAHRVLVVTVARTVSFGELSA